MTSAPSHASASVHEVPASNWVRSRTFTSSSAVFCDMMSAPLSTNGWMHGHVPCLSAIINHAAEQSLEATLSGLDFSDVDGTIQRVRLELYRENIEGALALVDAAADARPDPRYATEADGIRRRLVHMQSREAYLAA